MNLFLPSCSVTWPKAISSAFMPSCSTKQTPLFHLSHSQALSENLSTGKSSFLAHFCQLLSDRVMNFSLFLAIKTSEEMFKFSDPLWACCCIDLVHFLLYHGVCGYVLHMVVWPCWILDFRLREEEPSLLCFLLKCFELHCVYLGSWILFGSWNQWDTIERKQDNTNFGLLVWNSFIFSFWVLASTCEFCGRVIQILNN